MGKSRGEEKGREGSRKICILSMHSSIKTIKKEINYLLFFLIGEDCSIISPEKMDIYLSMFWAGLCFFFCDKSYKMPPYLLSFPSQYKIPTKTQNHITHFIVKVSNASPGSIAHPCNSIFTFLSRYMENSTILAVIILHYIILQNNYFLNQL